ncbi:hypothetical protein MLD38_001077 [Melastoma candidum]|uniref:Uncharacterized protein n=1 Tax=Melastoma candidum TaxID=119954 RepID=A0ACB9SKP8_9MYRT|nr:hypothetical protein MLD38_001077 [Melastoma candidum]
MALSSQLHRTLKPFRALSSSIAHRLSFASTAQPQSNDPSSSNAFVFSSPNDDAGAEKNDDVIFLKANRKSSSSSSSVSDGHSVSMPTSFMTGSIIGKRFYKEVTTRVADDGNGWSVMLDYRTLKTPTKRPLKLPTLGLAKAVAAEWEYQQKDGIRPFTMPLMRLACTALERVPVTRPKIIENLMKKFNQDLVFCRAPEDHTWTNEVLDRQVEKIDPLLDWVKSEFGVKPILYTSIFGGKQDDRLVKAVEDLLKKTDDCELAAIDAMAAAGHSLIIAIAIFRGKLQIEEALELIRLEEDLQVERWGLVEGGHDVDIADLRVEISSAAVFLGLSRRV